MLHVGPVVGGWWCVLDGFCGSAESSENACASFRLNYSTINLAIRHPSESWDPAPFDSCMKALDSRFRGNDG
jgi:hypothetical protein